MNSSSLKLQHAPLHFKVFAVFFIIVFFAIKQTRPYQMLDDADRMKYKEILLPNVTGPESIAFDCNGRGPYVGVSDGRILKWRGAKCGWSDFAVTSPNRKREVCDGSTNPEMEETCGRPLGLKFDNRTCELYIADAYFGLQKVGRGGGVAEQLASGYLGVPFKLTNALDVDTVTGEVYFTDSSTVYQRREYVMAIMQGDRSGRVLKYDPRTKQVTVLMSSLLFPNGLALSNDSSFVVIAETGMMQLLRLWIKGPSAGTVEVFAQLGRYPDNIKRNNKGEFWVALNSGRGILRMRAKKDCVTEDWIPWFSKDPVAIKYDQEGRVVEMVDGEYKKTLESVSEVAEFGETLWIGSVTMSYLGKYKV